MITRRSWRQLRQHAMSVNDRARHQSDQVMFESYEAVGFNYRLTDIQAAIGRCQLNRLPEMVTERRVLAGAYSQASGANPRPGAAAGSRRYPHQLAELLRAAAGRRRSTRGDAAAAWMMASPHAAASCASTASRPMPTRRKATACADRCRSRKRRRTAA